MLPAEHPTGEKCAGVDQGDTQRRDGFALDPIPKASRQSDQHHAQDHIGEFDKR